MNDITEKIEAFFLTNNINLFGTAPASSLETESSGYRPSDVLPGAKSILCLGIPLPKGIFECVGKAEQMYWRAAAIYYRRIDAILMQTAVIIEEQGDIAVPVYG
jgi:epoxyqueuosine reductase QueG